MEQVNPRSYGLMERLKAINDSGDIETLGKELRHYLSTLASQGRSPLLNGLLDMYRSVVPRDTNAIGENLALLDLLITSPRLDIVEDLLEIFYDMASVLDFDASLSTRFVTIVKGHFNTFSPEFKISVIDSITKISSGNSDLMKNVAQFLLRILDLSDGFQLGAVLHGFIRLLDEDPDLDVLFENSFEPLFDRYILDIEAENQKNFLDLFSRLPRLHDYMKKKTIPWLKSSDRILGDKALAVLPVLTGNTADLESFDRLLDHIADEEPEFQSRVVDTIATTMARNFDYYLSRIMKRWFSRDHVDEGMEQGFHELFIMLGGKDFDALFNRLIGKLGPSKEPCTTAIISILKALYLEYRHPFETSLVKTSESFPSLRLPEKIEFLDKIALLLDQAGGEFPILWLASFLKNLSNESGLTATLVKDRAAEILQILREKHPELDESIQVLNSKVSYIESAMSMVKNYPRVFRERVDYLITQSAQNKAAKIIDTEYASFLDKILDFDRFINGFEFRHLFTELLEDWQNTKDYILDDLNLMKEFLEQSIKSKYETDKKVMLDEVKQLSARRDVLLAEADETEKELDEVSRGEDFGLNGLISRSSSLFVSMLFLDLDVNHFLSTRPEASTGFGSFFDAWESVRVKVESIVTRSNEIAETVVAGVDGSSDASMNFNRLQSLFGTAVKDASSTYKILLTDLQSSGEAFSKDLQMKSMNALEKNMAFKRSKLLDLIDQQSQIVNKAWRALSQASRDVETFVSLSKLYDEWQVSKENMVEQINSIYHARMEQLDAEKIRQLLQVINPIPLEALKSNLKSISATRDVDFIQAALNIIQKYDIPAQIREKAIVNTHASMELAPIEELVKIKPVVSPTDSGFRVKVIVENNSFQDLYDVSLALKASGMALSLENCKPRHERFPSLEIGKILETSWDITLQHEPDGSEKGTNLECVRLTVILNGKLPGNRTVAFESTTINFFIVGVK